VDRRVSLRLGNYDYTAPGGYFVTACTLGRACLFGDVLADQVHLNPFGNIVADSWRGLASLPGVEPDAFVVMPNHVHGVLFLRAGQGPPLHLGIAVCQLKSGAARRINTLRQTPGKPVWQRGYHERVIRNEDELRSIREYIDLNPLSWALDAENPDLPM
jgi:putative transposase